MPAPRHVVMPIVAVLACTSVACSEETKDRLRDLAASRTPSRSLSSPVSVSVRPTRSPRPTPTATEQPTSEPTEEPEPTTEPTRERTRAPTPTQQPTTERTPASSATQEPSDLAEPSPAAAEELATDGSAPWVVLVFVAILAGVAVGVYAVTKRRSGPDASDGR
jgi:hypothetical protein